MVREHSKLMLRAFNAEADTLVRWLKPYKIDGALNRLKKVSDTIERLGKTMDIRISPQYYQLRVRELELTSDFHCRALASQGFYRLLAMEIPLALANRTLRRLNQKVWLANAPVFLAVIATGLMAGASLMGTSKNCFSMRIACGSGVNVHESERERSGIICRQFCGIG